VHVIGASESVFKVNKQGKVLIPVVNYHQQVIQELGWEECQKLIFAEGDQACGFSK